VGDFVTTNVEDLADHRLRSSNDFILWNIGQDESDRISALLDADFSDFGIIGHKVNREKCTCTGCGKRTGLDDFVHTALQTGVHSKAWMVKAFSGPRISDGTPHVLQCSICNTTFKNTGSDSEVCLVFY
jgi:hypothetical protein